MHSAKHCRADKASDSSHTLTADGARKLKGPESQTQPTLLGVWAPPGPDSRTGKYCPWIRAASGFVQIFGCISAPNAVEIG